MPFLKATPDWARWATEVFQPPLVLAVLLVVLPWGANPSVGSLVWGVSAALVTCGVPLSVVLLLVRRGALTDHHVSEKRHRRPVMVGTIVVLTVSWGLIGLLFIPVALFVSWSRIKLRDHSGVQVVAGFVFGVMVLGGIYGWVVT